MFNGASTAKRFIDIEKALQWAFRDELPKRGRRGGPWVVGSSTSWLSGASSDRDDPGARSCNDARDPGFPAAAGDPHPDSLVIETAVNALTAWAGYRFGAHDLAALTCGVPVNFDVAAIGAEAIASMTGTVTVNARMATRPKWTAQRPAPHWVVARNGKSKVLIDAPIIAKRPWTDPFGRELTEIASFPCAPIRQNLYPSGAYCPLAWRPDPGRLVVERAEHCAWRAAMEILAASLSGRLTALAVLPPAATWAPWRNAAEREELGGLLTGPEVPRLFAPHEPSIHRLTREQAAAVRRTALRRAPQPSYEAAGRGAAGRNRAQLGERA